MPIANTVAKYTLSFEADTSKAKRTLADLKTQLDNLYLNTNTATSALGIDKELEQAAKAARELRGLLENSSSATGKFDLTKFTQGLKQSGYSLEDYNKLLMKLGPAGASAMQQLSQQIVQADTKVNVLNGSLKKFADGLKNTAMWTIQSKAVHAVESAISGAYAYAQKLNGSLNDIRIVTEYSADKMADFAKQANKAAKALSTTTNEYVKGSLIFYQQGLSDEVVKQRTETTIKLANTSGESASDISSYMTSIWNNFEDGSKTVEYYADALSYLGAASAATNADIAEGLQSFASTANTVGLSYEYAASALTTLVDVTQQSASTIGNSLKTIFARLSSVSMGETLDDGVTLTKYTKALEQMGVTVINEQGNLKDMDDILDDMASKWGDLSNAQQVAVAQVVGGVRQYNNLISLMENYDKFKGFVSGAQDSEGYLQTQQDIYAESWAAASDRVEAAWESLYTQIIDDKTLISITNIVEKIVSGISEVMKGMGGLKGALPAIFLLMQKVYGEGQKFANQIQKTVELVNTLVNKADLEKQNKETVLGAETVRFDNVIQQIDDAQSGVAWDVRKNFQDYRKEYHSLDAGEKVKYSLTVDKMYKNLVEASNFSEQILKNTDAMWGKEAAAGINGATGSKLQAQLWQQQHEAAIVAQIQSNKGKRTQAANSILSALEQKDKGWVSDDFKATLEEAASGKAGKFKHLYAIPEKEYADIMTKINESVQEQIESEIKKGLLSNPDNDKETIKETDKTEALNKIIAAKKAENYLTEEQQKRVEEIVQLYKETNDLQDQEIQKHIETTAIQKQQQEELKKKEQTYQNIASAISLVSATAQGLSAIDGFWESLQSGEATITSLIGSLGSLLMAAQMASTSLKALVAQAETAGVSVGLAGKVAQHGWGWISAIMIVIYGVVKLISWTVEKLKSQTLEAKLEAATKATEACKTAAEDAASAYSNLQDALDDLDDVYGTLNNLTKGTTEWTQAIKNANSQAQELIDTYNLAYGDYYFDDNGVIRFTSSAKKSMETQAQQKVNDTNSAYLASKKYQAELTERVAEQAYNTKRNNAIRVAVQPTSTTDGGTSPVGDEALVETSAIKKNYEVAEDAIKKALQEGKVSFSADGWQQILEQMGISQDVIDLLDSNSTLRESLTSLTEATVANTNALQAENMSGIYAAMQDNEDWQNLTSEEKEYLAAYGSKEIEARAEELKANIAKPTDEQLAEFALAQGWNQDTASGKWVDSNGTSAELNNIDTDLYKTWAAHNEAQEQVYAELANKNRWNDIIAEGKAAKKYSLNDLNQSADRTQFDYGSDGLDTTELAEYQQYLQENSANLKENADMAERVAQANMQFNVGLADIIDNYETYLQDLDESNKGTADYVAALGDVRDAYSRMLDISSNDLSEEFLTSADNLNLMKEAANGSLEAITQLRENAAASIINSIELPEDAPEQLQSQVQSLLDQIENSEDFENQLEIGASIDSLDDTAFVDSLNLMLANANMSIEEVQKVLNSLGFEPTIDYEEVPWNSQTMATQTVYSKDDKGNYSTITNTAKLDENTMVWIPKINSKKTTYRGSPKAITSSANKAAAKSNADSGGSKSTKNKDDEIERYHVIKEKLEDINEQLDRIAEAQDRAFGQSKIDLMQQEVAEYDNLIARQKEYISEIQAYYKSDAAKMAGYGAVIENGIITNYADLVGKYVDMYNTGSIDEDSYNAFKDALTNFEDSSDLLSEQTDELVKLQNEKIDKLLAIVDEKVNLQLELNNDEMEYFDFLLETMADDAVDAAEAIGLLGQKVNDLLENNQAYTDGLKNTLGVYGVTAEEAQGVLDGSANLQAIVDKYGIDAQGVEQLQEYRDGLMDVAKELISLREDVYEKLNEVMDEFNEKMDDQISKIEQAQSVMDHYKNIIDIVGKDRLGISDGVLKQMSAITVSNATSSLTIARQQKEQNQKALEEAQVAYQTVLQTGSEEDIKLMEEQLKELEDKVADSTETWASSFEEAISVIQDAFTDAIQAAADKFDETMAGTYGSLEKLQDTYDKQKTLDDLTLDTYEKIYQLNKLNRDITNSIDDTDNIAGKQKLLELQKEINEAQNSTTEMTEYEVEFLQKKYELYLAQIALEEAQNAKNQVRMNRDNEGNWSYIYTADASATADAQQNYEDKLYELEKLNQEYIDKLQEQLITSFAQYKEEIAALNLTDEERAALLEEYWTTLTEKYGSYLDGALGDATWITNQIIGLDHELIDSYDETYLSKFTNTNSMIELEEQFKQASQQMVAEVNNAYSEFARNTEEAMDAAGTSTTDFAETVRQNMDSTVQSTQEAVNAASNLKDEYSSAFSNAANSVASFAQNYANQIQTVVNNTALAVNSINSLIRAIASLNGTSANTVSAVTGSVTSAATSAIASGQAKVNAASNAISSNTNSSKISRHSSGSSGVIQVWGSGNIQTYNGKQFAQDHSGGNWYLVSQMTQPYSGAYQYAPGTEYYTAAEWKRLTGMATGGYTGEWGNSGRLAILHQKELVLNADDTSNFLSAIEMVRDITKSIDLQAQSQGIGLGALSAAGIASSSAFEQNVNIQASFPNATNHSEIEEAFNNLINRASQFAGRK